MLWRLRTLAAAMLIVGLTTSAWATCVDGAALSESQQMACCRNSHHTCGVNGPPADCCQSAASAQPPQATIIKAAQHVGAPVRAALAWATLPAPTALAHAERRGVRKTTSPEFPPGPPAYLVFSNLLI